MKKLITKQEGQLKVVLLYRASTKKQTDSENDIPLQRDILRPWADMQGEFIREFVEGGVSGFKVPADQRDSIVEIKAMADRREFDILGIYMSDRLGRIADETPLIVAYLNARGVKIISYREGEISAGTHIEKLMTYIRFWQAEGESLKTSARVKDAIEQKVKAGKWRGGHPPYGYRIVSRGTLNYKGKPIFDVEIDPEASEVVKTSFRLYGKEHYGCKSIAKYLNDKGIPSAKGGLWSGQLIMKMLKNKTYIGIYELHRKEKEFIVSTPMENLKIISEQDFNEVQKICKQNTRNANAVRPTRRGTLLLTGLLYCNCGRKFTSQHHKRMIKRQNGTTWAYERNSYRCTSFLHPKEGQADCCHKLLTAEELDAIVIRDAKRFMLSSKNWSEIFDAQNTMGKKAMLIDIIYRIQIFFDKIEIGYYNLDKEKDNLLCYNPDVNSLTSVRLLSKNVDFSPERFARV